jgi:hypothetical protein
MWDPPQVEAFRPYLTSGENIVWMGQPASGIRFRPGDIFLIPFSLLWGGFAIFWEAMALRAGAPLFFALWGIPFVLVGLYMIIGRFVVDAFARTRTRYAVTSRRALILSGLITPHIRSIDLKGTNDIGLSLRGDGSGTISFQSGPMFGSWSGAGFWPGVSRYTPPAFEMIPEAKSVFDQIQFAKAA